MEGLTEILVKLGERSKPCFLGGLGGIPGIGNTKHKGPEAVSWPKGFEEQKGLWTRLTKRKRIRRSL